VPAGSHPFAFAPWEQGVDGEPSATAAAWARLYPSESFHLVLPKEGAEVAAPTAPFACDLVAAAGRQKQFLWQVSGPQYGNATFLADATRRYAQLLALMHQLPKAFLVPTYDMDLMVRCPPLAGVCHVSESEALTRNRFRFSGTRTWRGLARTRATRRRCAGA
jgi:hypothetical protein